MISLSNGSFTVPNATDFLNENALNYERDQTEQFINELCERTFSPRMGEGAIRGDMSSNESVNYFILVKRLIKAPLNADSTPPCIIWNPEHAHHQEDHLVY